MDKAPKLCKAFASLRHPTGRSGAPLKHRTPTRQALDNKKAKKESASTALHCMPSNRPHRLRRAQLPTATAKRVPVTRETTC